MGVWGTKDAGRGSDCVWGGRVGIGGRERGSGGEGVNGEDYDAVPQTCRDTAQGLTVDCRTRGTACDQVSVSV